MQRGRQYPDLLRDRAMFGTEPTPSPWRGLPKQVVCVWDGWIAQDGFHYVGRHVSDPLNTSYTFGHTSIDLTFTIKDWLANDRVLKCHFELKDHARTTYVVTCTSSADHSIITSFEYERAATGWWAWNAHAGSGPDPAWPQLWVGSAFPTHGWFTAIDYMSQPFFIQP
jgi:hypothetical protein